MNNSPSTLNPFAESYIPLALRVAGCDKSDPALSYPHQLHHLVITDDLSQKIQEDGDDFAGASSQIHDQITCDVKLGDGDFEMDLAYLQMSFPGMSDRSVMDVYAIKNEDLEDSTDMLSQLESSDCLPDALDIGDGNDFFRSI